MPVANLQEAWPIVVTDDRPYTLIQAAAPGEGDQIANALERALPEIGEPDERKNSPGDTFELMIYDATREELNARRGLMLQWLDASGAPIGEPAISAAFDETPPAGATQYRITGLVSVAEQFNGYLGPVDPDPGVTITVEEQPSYAAGTGITSTICRRVASGRDQRERGSGDTSSVRVVRGRWLSLRRAAGHDVRAGRSRSLDPLAGTSGHGRGAAVCRASLRL